MTPARVRRSKRGYWMSAGRRELLRVLRRLTATEAARRCRCTVAAISALARGVNREPKLSLALALNRELGIDAHLWEEGCADVLNGN